MSSRVQLAIVSMKITTALAVGLGGEVEERRAPEVMRRPYEAGAAGMIEAPFNKIIE